MVTLLQAILNPEQRFYYARLILASHEVQQRLNSRYVTEGSTENKLTI